MKVKNEYIGSGTEPENEVRGDPPVYYTQQWLNRTYCEHPNWVMLEEDGITGWGTIGGLVRALQIHLSISVDGEFGNGTARAFKARFADTNGILVPKRNEQDNIYGIIAGGLWCKGYYGASANNLFGSFDGVQEVGIKAIKRDAGLAYEDANIDVHLMKALLSMDQFVLLRDYGGNLSIRQIQQYLNANYLDIIGLIPCDGLYQREMNRALIKVLQLVEGYTGSDIDGEFGNGTKQRLPIISKESQSSEAIRLFCFCLTCNGFVVGGEMWNSIVEEKTKEFQSKCFLEITGIGDTNTWMSLLLSKGNSERSATACDCATILDGEKAMALYDSGYQCVGRYLSGFVGSGTDKALSREEMRLIFNSGLRLFLIYQEGDVYLNRYTYSFGLLDAEKAISRAIELGVPNREYIFFAVDYDVMNDYIPLYVVPYFEAINAVMEKYGNRYLIGIYGSRNVCNRICFEYALASSSFISDMSTGYSGNMGFILPKNWAFDQFHEYYFTKSNIAFPLDKDLMSNQYTGFNYFAPQESNNVEEEVTEREKLDAAYESIAVIAPKNYLGEKSAFYWNTEPIVLINGPVVITITYMGSSFFSINEKNVEIGTYTISNGKIDGFTTSISDSILESFDASYKANLGVNGIQLIVDLAKTVKCGKISFGIKLSDVGTLTFYVILEHYLGSSQHISNSVSVKYEFSVKNDKINNELVRQYEEAFNTQKIKSGVVAVSVVILVAMLLSPEVGIVDAIITLLDGLLGWAGLLYM